GGAGGIRGCFAGGTAGLLVLRGTARVPVAAGVAGVAGGFGLALLAAAAPMDIGAAFAGGGFDEPEPGGSQGQGEVVAAQCGYRTVGAVDRPRGGVVGWGVEVVGHVDGAAVAGVGGGGGADLTAFEVPDLEGAAGGAGDAVADGDDFGVEF